MRMTIFVVFSALLMLSLNLKVDAGCQPNGCSVWNIVPYKQFFAPARNKHDVCYACGVSNGWTQHQCDVAFKRDMQRLCGGLTLDEMYLCRAAAVDYYHGVLLFGWKHYKNPSLGWCKYCPKSSGDPNSALGR